MFFFFPQSSSLLLQVASLLLYLNKCIVEIAVLLFESCDFSIEPIGLYFAVFGFFDLLVLLDAPVELLNGGLEFLNELVQLLLLLVLLFQSIHQFVSLVDISVSNYAVLANLQFADVLS